MQTHAITTKTPPVYHCNPMHLNFELCQQWRKVQLNIFGFNRYLSIDSPNYEDQLKILHLITRYFSNCYGDNTIYTLKEIANVYQGNNLQAFLLQLHKVSLDCFSRINLPKNVFGVELALVGSHCRSLPLQFLSHSQFSPQSPCPCWPPPSTSA